MEGPPYLRFRISTKEHGFEAEGNGHAGVFAIFALAVVALLGVGIYFGM
jgi:hypothetical protein